MRDELGILDADIRAIKYHTTGRPNRPSKVLYVADYVSIEQDYPGVERVRKRLQIWTKPSSSVGDSPHLPVGATAK